jgi:hypothetical protein
MAMYKVDPGVRGESQTKASSCWYSCLRMLHWWKYDKGDTSKHPSKILDKMDQSPMLYPWAMKDEWGIDVGECRETARMLGLQATGDGELDAFYIKETLKKRGPIWVAGNWGKGNHVIVIVGADEADGRLRVINPYYNPDGGDSPMSVSELNKRGSLWRNCDASVMVW